MDPQSKFLREMSLQISEPAGSGRSRQVEARFRGAAKTTSWMPFLMADGRHMTVSAVLNGMASPVVIDTGVSSTVLDERLVARMGLDIKRRSQSVGLTGSRSSIVAEGIEIALGNLSLKVPKVVACDLSLLAKVSNHEIAAVIGQDLFNQLVVEIDFVGKQVAFSESPTLEVIEGGVTLPLRLGDYGLFEISISVEGGVPIRGVIDLGSDTPIYLSPVYASREGLFEGRLSSTSLSAGIEGPALNKVAQLNAIGIGPLELKNVPMASPAQWTNSAEAFIGLPVMSRFRLAIDASRGSMTLWPEQSIGDQPFKKDRSGIGAMPLQNGLKIVHVASGSPAEKAGLLEGDEITAIDGRAVDEAYFKKRQREGTRPAGTILRLLLRRGDEVELTLADYF